jgi:hypothetical protein
MQHK